MDFNTLQAALRKVQRHDSLSAELRQRARDEALDALLEFWAAYDTPAALGRQYARWKAQLA